MPSDMDHSPALTTLTLVGVAFSFVCLFLWLIQTTEVLNLHLDGGKGTDQVLPMKTVFALFSLSLTVSLISFVLTQTTFSLQRI